ncbi:hypothetical protein [Blastococcus mobilis]|uniref:Uncharacterized protein n=1 Tax=Blastococcus mobilis TaxID=1938746 RepID=A0A238XAG1_9ACTN|nr:hypothetical protein [Blastococcus mobilis]SNR54839.1 hypothetical protein SAMN06272737_11223 [Blastococcus mobilis]
MSPSRALTRGAVLVLFAGTAACGVDSVAPKVELRDALAAFAEARSGSVVVSLASSEEDVRAFLIAAGEDAAAADDSVLRDLLGAELAIAYDHGEDETGTADDTSRLRVLFDDEDHGELRVVDEILYARVDLPALTERFPDMTEGVDELEAELDAADLGSLQETAEAALAGDWVSVDMGEGSWFAEQQKIMEEEGMPLPEDVGQRVMDLAGKAMDASVAVRRAGDRLIATVNTREMYAQVGDELTELLAEIMPGAEEGMPPAREVPDQEVSASFWVEDGELQRVELDLAQFRDGPAGHFVICVEAADGEPIEAPDDAVAVDVEELIAMSGATPQLLPGGSVGAGGTDVGATAMAKSISMDFQVYAEMEGVPPTVEHLPMIAEYSPG